MIASLFRESPISAIDRSPLVEWLYLLPISGRQVQGNDCEIETWAIVLKCDFREQESHKLNPVRILQN
jgi:hypothetical protein